jgi:hypothetical protein
MIDRLKTFQDLMGGGAWPFLVGGLICLLNCDNERDLPLLTSRHLLITAEVWYGRGKQLPELARWMLLVECATS